MAKNIFGKLFWDELKPVGRAIIKDRNGTIHDFLGCIPAESFKGKKVSVIHEESKVIITIQIRKRKKQQTEFSLPFIPGPFSPG